MKSKNQFIRILDRGFCAILISLLALSFLATTPTRAAGLPNLNVNMVLNGGSFNLFQTGRTYTITVSNIGDVPTTGPATVVFSHNTVPAGLTVTALSGTNWNCTLGTLTCTRSDMLNNGESYSVITVTVTVLIGAPPSIQSQAVVSGGGADDDPDNNTSLVISTVSDAGTDLIVTNATLSNPLPDPGEPFSINVTVKNQGGVGSESITYRHVFVDTGDPNNLPPDPGTGCPSTDDPYINYFRQDLNDPIPAGVEDTKAVDIPGLSAGSHELWVYVDATCINADEISENNNAYGPISIIIESVPLVSPWIGGVTVESNVGINAVGRPHTGTEIMAYNGFTSGSTTMYVPMLFKNMWTGYDSALYVQNLDPTNTANLTFSYYDVSGNLMCSKNDTLNALSSKGYWLPAETCLPASWYGAVVVTSNRNIVAVGRPHIEGQVTTYNGFASGSTTMYVPMLFKDAFGGDYDSALYVQNITQNTANITIEFRDNSGELDCVKNDTIARLSSKGYWLPSVTCDTGALPVGWVGGVVVTSNQNIVAVGRPHIGTQITTYSGFGSGGLSMSVPMLFKRTFGSYDSALYIQNVSLTNPASVTIEYYDADGTLSCTKHDVIAELASKGYWVPTTTCDTGALPDGWSGSAKITSTQNIIAVARPHLGTEILTYDGAANGNISNYIPMLFNNAFGSYNSAFYLQNLNPSSTAVVVIKFFDSSGILKCMRNDVIAPLASRGYWLPSVMCFPAP